MKILSPEEIKIPKKAVVIEDKKEGDWEHEPVMGAVSINPSLDWTPYITEYELQRNAYFDAYDCVTQATWNMYQSLIFFLIGIKTNWSKRWTALRAGTKPGVGVSVNAPLESVRTQGGVKEEDCPSMSPTMTQAEFYSPISPKIDTQECFLKDYGTNHEWVKRARTGAVYSTMEQIKPALGTSPVMASVNGNYKFDANGMLSNDTGGYSHEVLIVKMDEGKCVYVLDSENPDGLLPIKWGYKFGYCKVGYVTVKKKEKASEPFIIVGSKVLKLAMTGKYAGQYFWIKDEDTFKTLVGEFNSVDLVRYQTFPENYSGMTISIYDQSGEVQTVPVGSENPFIKLFNLIFK